MNLLAIETTSTICSVALKINDTYFEAQQENALQQAHIILPLIDKLLTTANIRLQDLTGVAFSAGPASFTGTRLGLSVLQGLAVAHDLPIIPINTLHAQAQGIYRLHAHQKFAICTDAYMGELYWSTFLKAPTNELMTQTPARLISHRENILLEGTGWAAIGNGWVLNNSYLYTMLKEQISYTYFGYAALARDVLDLAEIAYQQGKIGLAQSVELSYLRDELAWKRLEH